MSAAGIVMKFTHMSGQYILLHVVENIYIPDADLSARPIVLVRESSASAYWSEKKLKRVKDK